MGRRISSKARERGRSGIAAAVLAAVVGMFVMTAAGSALVDMATAAAQNPPPGGISFTLEGCRLPVSNGVPDYTLPLNGQFICKDQTWDGSNDDYTTGNLGKSWNELDLVPYRIVVDAGNSAPNTSSFTFAAVLDNFDAGHPGYDVISAPTLKPGSDSAGRSPVSVRDAYTHAA